MLCQYVYKYSIYVYGAVIKSSSIDKEEITIAKITLTTYDLGGHKTARKVWKQYFPAVNGIVFMVDAFKQKKFDESRIELEV